MAKRTKQRRAKSAQNAPSKPAELPGLTTSSRIDKTDVKFLAIVGIAAAALRAVFYFLSRANNPVMFHPIMDGKYHQEWANAIVAGNFWGDEVFFRAPLYPYFLAGLFGISDSSIAFAIITQHVIGTGSVLLIYVLARQFFSSRVALIAGMIGALYWPFVYFEGDLLIVTVIVFLDLVALILLTKAMRNHRVWLLLVCGVVIGLSAIARPNILVLLAVLPVVVRVSLDQRGSPRAWIRRSLVVYVGAACVIVPVLVRNYVIGRDVVPIASQGGVNLYIGNNPDSDGRTAIVPGTRWDWWGGFQDAIRIAEQDVGHPLKPSQVSNYYTVKALKFVFGSPDQSLPLLLRKLYLFWAGGERANNKYIYFFWEKSGISNIPLPGFWFVTPFGLLGAVLLWPRRRDFWLLYLFVLSYMLGVIAFFVNARFRIPIVPVLIVFAAYALYYLWHALRQRSPGLAKALIVLIVCELIVNLDFVTFAENKTHTDSLSHYTLGNAYLKMGDPDRAIQEYEEAGQIFRRYPTAGYRLVERNVDYNLGRLYSTRGMCEKAIPRLERVGGNDEYTLLAKQLLADCYVTEDRFAEASRIYDEMLAPRPNDDTNRDAHVRVLIAWAKSLRSSGDLTRAREVLEQARNISPGHPTVERALRDLDTVQ